MSFHVLDKMCFSFQVFNMHKKPNYTSNFTLSEINWLIHILTDYFLQLCI